MTSRWNGMNIACDFWDKTLLKFMHHDLMAIFFFSAQGSITDIVCEIFGIEHDYFGTVLSNMARVSYGNLTLYACDRIV